MFVRISITAPYRVVFYEILELINLQAEADRLELEIKFEFIPRLNAVDDEVAWHLQICALRNRFDMIDDVNGLFKHRREPTS